MQDISSVHDAGVGKGKRGSSKNTTVPKTISEAINLESGDKLLWDYNEDTKKLTVTVIKLKH